MPRKQLEKKTPNQKIGKKRVIQKPAKKNNPRRAKVIKEKKRIKSGPRNFYTVGQDSQILEKIFELKKGQSQTEMLKGLQVTLGKSIDSLRDRIKRYLKKLSPSDQKHVLKQGKTHPHYYIHFKKSENENYKLIDKITVKEPFYLKPRRKNIEGEENQQNDMLWLKDKLQSKDQYFAIDMGVQLLDQIFTELKKDGVSQKKIEKLVKNVYNDITLEEILKNLLSKQFQ